MSWDLRRGDTSERDEVLANIAVVPLPDTDPIHGSRGPLNELWHAGQCDVARRPPTVPADPHSAEIRPFTTSATAHPALIPREAPGDPRRHPRIPQRDGLKGLLPPQIPAHPRSA